MNTKRLTLAMALLLAALLLLGAVACGDDDDDDDNDDNTQHDDDDDDDDDDNDDNDDDDNDDNDDDDDDDNDDDDDDDDDSTPGFVVWHHELPAGIPENVALAGPAGDAWVGVNLNNERVSHFALTGDGTPDFEIDLLPLTPDAVLVAAAEDISLGVALVQVAGAPLAIKAYNTTGGVTPLWEYDFDAGFTVASRALDVAADGSVVLVAGRDPVLEETLLVVLDGSSGAETGRLSTKDAVGDAELSDDGARAVLTKGATAQIIAVADFSELFSFAVSGAGGRHRISRDGTAAAAGGFDVRAYAETVKGWDQVFTQQDASQWYGGGIALAGDGSALLACSRTYTTDREVTCRVADLASGLELNRFVASGGGTFQNNPARAQASEDGAIFALASWGLEDNSVAEVLIFDAAGDLLGSHDTPGSPFDLGMTADGRYLLVGGKAVHANDIGSGGDVYVLDTDALGR
jgi:hypothetical protein